MTCFAYVDNGPFWLVHETGHFFGLHHTFDETLGTLVDNVAWTTQNQISMNAFGKLYAALSAAQQQVDDTFFNVMSYHNAATKDTTENRLTEA